MKRILLTLVMALLVSPCYGRDDSAYFFAGIMDDISTIESFVEELKSFVRDDMESRKAAEKPFDQASATFADIITLELAVDHAEWREAVRVLKKMEAYGFNDIDFYTTLYNKGQDWDDHYNSSAWDGDPDFFEFVRMTKERVPLIVKLRRSIADDYWGPALLMLQEMESCGYDLGPYYEDLYNLAMEKGEIYANSNRKMLDNKAFHQFILMVQDPCGCMGDEE